MIRFTVNILSSRLTKTPVHASPTIPRQLKKTLRPCPIPVEVALDGRYYPTPTPYDILPYMTKSTPTEHRYSSTSSVVNSSFAHFAANIGGVPRDEQLIT
jgi:hypothetical protein